MMEVTYDYDKIQLATQAKILSHSYKLVKEDATLGVLPTEQQKDLAITLFIQFGKDQTTKRIHTNQKEIEMLRHTNTLSRGKSYGTSFKR